jgi:hypothetical protein
MLAATTTR